MTEPDLASGTQDGMAGLDAGAAVFWRERLAGMSAATLLGIFFVPALFVFVERLTHRKRNTADEADH